MMKTLKCSDIGFDCAAVVNAETIGEMLDQAAAHAKEVHGVEVSAEMAKEIATKIQG